MDEPEDEGADRGVGAAFAASPRKAFYGVLGGLFLAFIGLVAIAWRVGLFQLGNRRPGIFLTICAAVVGGAGVVWALISFVQMFRKQRVVVGADRVRIVAPDGDRERVLAQVLFANVAELVFVRDDAGKRVGLALHDREADGTFADGVNAIRPWDHGGGYSFIIEDHYEGRIEDVLAAVDAALSAWREAQGDGPEAPKPWLR